MKEGVLLYITQGKSCDDQQLERFIEQNGLSGIPLSVAGRAKDAPSFYDAYKILQEKRVDIIECFSVRVNEEKELELLKSTISLDPRLDLLKYCSPEELGLERKSA